MSVQHKNECRFIGTIKPNNKFTEGFELKYTAGGTAVLTINMCVTEEFKGREGDARFKSTYIPVRAWGEKAEAWAKSLKLYAVIDILTAFRTSSFTTSAGEKRYEHKFDVIALKVLEHSSAEEANATREAPAPAPAQAPARQEPQRPAAVPPPRPTPQPAVTPPVQPARPASAPQRPAPAQAPRRDDALPPPVDDDIPF